MKRKQVINLFHHKGKMTEVPIHDTIGMDDPWRYRNKSQIPVGTNRNGQIQMGFYRQRSHDIIDMDHCLIQNDDQNDMMNVIKSLLEKYHIPAYNEHIHQGLVRHVVIRKGYYTNEVMVILCSTVKVTTS